MKFLSASLATIFLFTQTVALAEGTKATLQIATLANVQSDEALADFIDQNIDAVQSAEAQEDAVEQLSKHGLKVEARWNKKLVKAMPRIATKLADAYAEMTDTQIATQIADVKAKAIEVDNAQDLSKIEAVESQSQDQKRAVLAELSIAGAKEFAPQLAHEIGKAGGAVNYLLKAKKGLKSGSGWAMGFTNKYAKYACIVLGVILIWACFGIPVVIAELLVGAFLTLAIMSAFAPDRTGTRRY